MPMAPTVTNMQKKPVTVRLPKLPNRWNFVLQGWPDTAGPPVLQPKQDTTRPRASCPHATSRSTAFSFQVVLGAGVVFGVPFGLFYRLILFHFYVRGSFLLDTGLLASLMYHATPALNLPPSLGGESFFAFHVAPILMLVSAASTLLPFSMPQVFAGFVGLCHGLLALAVYWLLVEGHGGRRGWPLALAVLASVAFACNGLALDIARFPHFETFAAASLLLFFVALVLEHRLVAVACFLLAVATREDVGLHAFGFLAVWATVNRFRRVPWRETIWIAGFAIAGLAWSAASLLLQHRAFPNASSFVRVYLGDPPLSHLSAPLVATRLAGWLWLHPAIILPAIAAAIWARRSHNPHVIVGYVACIPWALLHVLAASELAGWMVGYYGYPFLVAMAWPWLAVRIRRRQDPAAPVLAMPSASLLAMVALSLLPLGRTYDPGRISLPAAFLQAPSAALQARTDRGIAAIVAARPALGRLVVDNSVAALRPWAFARTEVAGWSDQPPDTVVFFSEGFDAERLRAVTDLPGHYAIPGTELRISTDRPAQTMQALGFTQSERVQAGW